MGLIGVLTRMTGAAPLYIVLAFLLFMFSLSSGFMLFYKERLGLRMSLWHNLVQIFAVGVPELFTYLYAGGAYLYIGMYLEPEILLSMEYGLEARFSFGGSKTVDAFLYVNVIPLGLALLINSRLDGKSDEIKRV